jgi:hypothetical protein
VLRLVCFGTLLAAVVHCGAAPKVSQLVVEGRGGPALCASTVIISTALFFGGDSDSRLDCLGVRFVERVAEVVAHRVHYRAVVSRCLVVAACFLKLRLCAWRSVCAE